jgi:hypothetical protein
VRPRGVPRMRPNPPGKAAEKRCQAKGDK